MIYAIVRAKIPDITIGSLLWNLGFPGMAGFAA